MREELYRKLDAMSDKDKGDLLQAIFGLMEIAEKNNADFSPKDFFALVEIKVG